ARTGSLRGATPGAECAPITHVAGPDGVVPRGSVAEADPAALAYQGTREGPRKGPGEDPVTVRLEQREVTLFLLLEIMSILIISSLRRGGPLVLPRFRPRTL